MKRVTPIAVLALLLALPLVAQARELGPLVSVDWLAEHRGVDDLVVLDVRSAIDGTDRDIFELAHIPGAVYSSYTEAGWRREAAGVPSEVPPVAALERLIGSLGIDNDSDVVIVPAGTGAPDFGSAARVYWIFRLLGHDDVAILDGGFRAWERAGHAIGGGWNEPEPARFEADFRPGLIADTDTVARAREAGARIVDVRPAQQYRGEQKHPQARAAGRIPGAYNLEQTRLVDADSGSAVTGERLTTVLEATGLDDGGRTITVCNTGHFAAIGWFMLSEIAGREDVAVYDGSMIAWAQDPERPLQVERSGIARLVDWLVN